MKTYQDLEEAKKKISKLGEFCFSAIEEFRSSPEYAQAKDGEAYYNKHNVTIEKYQKFLYTVSGREVADIFSANYKLKTLFFRRLVTQQVQYVLGNGLFLNDTANKEKLGRSFDTKLQKLAKMSMAQGQAFGFWNYDHLEVFGFADTSTDAGFCPLYDEETAQLRAGLRFWSKKIGKKVLVRFTLYEEDGITEYKKFDGKIEEITPKKPYKTITKSTAIGITEEEGENYGTLPIIPLYCNDSLESELVGIRESIDCYDFIKSGLANAIDDTEGFYWILKNTGGMDDTDLAQFVQRMKTVKATVVDGDQGVDAEAHTIDVPVEARSRMLQILREDIYEDFQALDVKTTLGASAKTTQEIQASYQAQDNKCADFEYYLIDFCQQILALAGIDDEPTFRWNRVVNQLEQTNMILSCANYLTDETILKHLPFLTPEEVDEILQARDTEDMNQFNDEDEEDEDQITLADLLGSEE